MAGRRDLHLQVKAFYIASLHFAWHTEPLHRAAGNPSFSAGQGGGFRRESSSRKHREMGSEMREVALKSLFLSGALLPMVGLFAFIVGQASAGEAAYCLTCTSPDQTYLCRVTGQGARQDEVSKLYCIVRTTKKGGHVSCAASGSGENCHGVLKTYKYRGPSMPDWLAENPG
jgi:hypothetical protein